MKYISCLLFVIMLAVAACHSTNKKPGQLDTGLIHNPNTGDAKARMDTTTLPVMAFDTLEHDFGKIDEGAMATYEFKFKNVGKGALIISDVSATCGCTTPYYPKNIINPGQSDVIKVVFNSTGRPGSFNKGVTVVANTYPAQTHLKITGTVIAKEEN